jgi:type I restriction enzyme S subunit
MSFPSNWQVCRLGDIASFHDEQRVPIKAEDRAKRPGEFPYFGASGQIDSIDDFIFDGDYVLLAEDGANILNRSSPIAFRAKGKFWVNNHAHILKATSATCNEFLLYALEALRYERYNTGSAQPKLNKEVCESIKLALPSKSEQEKIVEILSDCDVGIGTIEREIESKKRSYKGACQHALSSANETRPLTEVATVLFSNVDKKQCAVQQPVMLCNYTDVFYNDFITSDLNFMESTASETESKKFALRSDDVLFTKDSETPEEIAVSAVVSEDIANLVCGYHLGIARPKDINGGYLGVAFKSLTVRNQFSRLAQGATRFGLNLDAMHYVNIPVLPRAQQTLMAKISKEHAREIDALSLQLSLLKKLKHGLMQQLMTGKLRVKGAS